MKNLTAKISNLRRTKGLHEALVGKGAHVRELIGLIYGRSGMGKTTALVTLTLGTNACYLEASPNWTAYTMLEDICKALGIPSLRRAKYMEDAICEQMLAQDASRRKALLIDEANRLFESRQGSKMLENLRAIHDRARCPLVLSGSGDLPSLLRHPKYEQFNSRISHRLHFAPCAVDDVQVLADELCDVRINPDLVGAIHETSQGSVRVAIVELESAETFALDQGWLEIGLKQYQAMQKQQEVDIQPTRKRRAA